MKRYVVDIMIILFILLIGASLIYKSDTTANANMSSQISQVEGNSSEAPIEDGQGDVGFNDYSGNNVGRIIYKIGDVISGALTYVFNIIVGGIKNLVD